MRESRTASAVVTVWQHVPDGSGGCRRCGGPASIIGRMGCEAGTSRTLRPCPAGFTAAGAPCDCNGEDPTHHPRPAAEAFADPLAPRILDAGFGNTLNGKLQAPVRFAWLDPAAADAEAWLEDDGGRL